jgi:hypothetical protein
MSRNYGEYLNLSTCRLVSQTGKGTRKLKASGFMQTMTSPEIIHIGLEEESIACSQRQMLCVNVRDMCGKLNGHSNSVGRWVLMRDARSGGFCLYDQMDVIPGVGFYKSKFGPFL